MTGPFSTKEGQERIISFVSKELLPCVKDIRNLSIETINLRPSFCYPCYRDGLNKIWEKYRTLHEKFLRLYNFHSTPDDFFRDIDMTAGKDMPVMVDYFNANPAIQKSFEEGFRLLEVIDREISRRYQSSDQRIATLLSISAITISIITAILK